MKKIVTFFLFFWACCACAESIPLFSELRVAPGAKQEQKFVLQAFPEGLVPVLTLKARLDFDKPAGYAGSMRITVNGTVLDLARCINKPLRVRARGGDVYSMAAGDLFSVFYAPDYTSAASHPIYGLLDDVDPALFQLNLEGLLKNGENAFTFEHGSPAIRCDLVMADAVIAFQSVSAAERVRKPAPEGPLPLIAPESGSYTPFTVFDRPDGVLTVIVGEDTSSPASESVGCHLPPSAAEGSDVYDICRSYSTPAGRWVNGSNEFFAVQRTIEKRDEVIVVRDLIKNLTAEKLPIMRRNEITLGDRLADVWLAGLRQPSKAGSLMNPANPTTYAATAKSGIGLMPLDDIARIHVVNHAADGSVGLSDNSLVLPPNGEYEAQWAVIPTVKPDYWSFINAARRLVDVNFAIPGAFVFLRAEPLTDAWTDAQLADFLKYKDAYYACASISYPLHNGHYPHGTAFQCITHDNFVNAFARWRKLNPDTKYLVYFHCFIDVLEDAPERFADARVLLSDGRQADYGPEYDRIFVPTDKNTYGPEIAKNVDVIFDKIGADGVYWDEHEYSRYLYTYSEPWDGCSGDIDPEKMTLTRLKSSVTLLSESWRVALAKRILARGPMVGNGPPFTRARMALKFPCFVETGSITNCTQAHLYTPIALGDHLTERSEVDAYNTMLAALDYGCVYHWYNDVTVVPTHPHLTRYMYPITPMELHEGYILGRERIITKVSGLFGWGDTAAHEVHVFDHTGTEATGFEAPFTTQDGKTWTELRLPEGYSAAIVRKDP